MKFDKLKPGMLLVASVPWHSWILVTDKQHREVIVDVYWTRSSGRFHKTYNKNMKRYAWPDTTYGPGTTKDAQDLIVALFTREITK